MIGISNPIVFYSITLLITISAILAIKFKNIFYSLISAIVTFFLAGLVFYILGSEYNAVIQIAIYGVAVPIVLGLAVMFTNISKDRFEKNNSNFRYVLFFVAGIFVLSLIYLVPMSMLVVPDSFCTDIINTNPQGAVSAIGQAIFVKYVWAFEIMSLLLTIVVIGFTMFRGAKCQK